MSNFRQQIGLYSTWRRERGRQAERGRWGRKRVRKNRGPMWKKRGMFNHHYSLNPVLVSSNLKIISFSFSTPRTILILTALHPFLPPTNHLLLPFSLYKDAHSSHSQKQLSKISFLKKKTESRKLINHLKSERGLVGEWERKWFLKGSELERKGRSEI